MRNLLEHPVTTDEILAVLRKAAVLLAKEHGEQIGSLDLVCMAEAIKRLKAANDWYVSRTDDNGAGPIVVAEGLSEEDAWNLYNLLTERGHKQVYAMQQKDD